MLKVPRVHEKIVRPGTVAGRCWTLFAFLIKTASSAGTRVAVRKVKERVHRKLNKLRRYGRSFLGMRFIGRAFSQDVPADRFHDLPWKFLGPDRRDTPGNAACIKILLVSHAACRTGTPLLFAQARGGPFSIARGRVLGCVTARR